MPVSQAMLTQEGLADDAQPRHAAKGRRNVGHPLLQGAEKGKAIQGVLTIVYKSENHDFVIG
eukprot:6306074-Prymnesium_polylepis.1